MKLINVRLYGGEVVTRCALSTTSDRVILCSEEEYARAQAEGRDPMTLAFPRADIVEELYCARKREVVGDEGQ